VDDGVPVGTAVAEGSIVAVGDGVAVGGMGDDSASEGSRVTVTDGGGDGSTVGICGVGRADRHAVNINAESRLSKSRAI
jgi:hypothetical protein